MTASEIYRTWFGLDRLTPTPMGEDLRRYRVLAEEPARTREETTELRRLKKRLTEAGIQDPRRG